MQRSWRSRSTAVAAGAVIGLFALVAPAWATHEYIAGNALYSDGSTYKVVMEGSPTNVTVKGVNIPAPHPGSWYVLMAGTQHMNPSIPCYDNRRVISPRLTRQADGTIAPFTFSSSLLEGMFIDEWQLCFYEQPFLIEPTAVSNPVYLYIFSTTH